MASRDHAHSCPSLYLNSCSSRQWQIAAMERINAAAWSTLSCMTRVKALSSALRIEVLAWSFACKNTYKCKLHALVPAGVAAVQLQLHIALPGRSDRASGSQHPYSIVLIIVQTQWLSVAARLPGGGRANHPLHCAQQQNHVERIRAGSSPFPFP